MIPVTRTFLPPIDEYTAILSSAWNNHWITNRGELTQQLESVLSKYLSVRNIILTTNGTIPLQIASKILGKGGEVITTPFSYIATTAAIVWENCTPVFVDIDSEYLTIDEKKIEEKITTKTTAILATHVFGNPCNVEVIEMIAKKNNLKVIYDAAHCFGVKYKDQSIFNFGDISTCSFHATKLFHTGEGGAMICNSDELNHKLFYSHNFGHNGPLDFFGLGINGKISELQSALGLAVFPYIDMIISERGKVVEYYNNNLNQSALQIMKMREFTNWNNSYYPVIFQNKLKLIEVQLKLNQENIFPRRYFNPSLNTINYTNGLSMPISESISERVLCLPLYVGINESDLERICSIINKVVSK